MTPDLVTYWRWAFDADRRLVHHVDPSALPERELAVLGIVCLSPVTPEQIYEWLVWVNEATFHEPAMRDTGGDYAAG